MNLNPHRYRYTCPTIIGIDHSYNDKTTERGVFMVYRTDTGYITQDDKHSRIRAEIEKDRQTMKAKLEMQEKARLEGNRIFQEKEAAKIAARENSNLAKAEKAFKEYEANLYQQPVGAFVK